MASGPQKYLVSPPAKQEVKGLSDQPIHDSLGHHVVPVVDRPPAVLEASCRVLFRPAWCLHDAIKGHERVCDYLPHDIALMPELINRPVANVLAD